ncbi:hypothetical protein IIA94_00875 [Patescibacteria group bacterium]|nr:hypothetical protein [Patescibacteria group bacterium]
MYKRLPVKKLTGDEQFKHIGNKQFSVLDFWQYGFSNLNSNVLRGALAEFIVENALNNKDQIIVRNPWGDYDVEAKDGKKIEVKCSSYIQDWDQEKLSRIVWSGLKAKEIYWSEAIKSYADIKQKDYKADIYILALLKHQDPATLNILDLNQWTFYILAREQLKDISRNSSSISLARLQKFKLEPVHFAQMKETISAL